VENVAPTIDLSGPSTSAKVRRTCLTLGNVIDPGQDTITKYRVDWGDGSFQEFSGSPAGLTHDHTFTDGPACHTVTVDLTDEDGTFANASNKEVTMRT